MSINELSNEEVLFMYFSNRKWLTTYEEIFEHKSTEETLEILDFGRVTVTRYIADEDVEKLKESKHYKYAIGIQEKLGPIVDMIEDIDISLYEKVKTCFDKIEI